ncbi:hypothetical protein RSOLAG1IB_12292 [Rhizoctonia solani AG-1 IB]|uniref:Uncharacterized protein n=1 Tax=Thanatephorus cucumeris (strain AG1-IB / isolate 7/3/14) TaxID=1108050 RepID=A0A0B7FV33_THACB|nr:hypothetical protein RSOLAG1IB_12292 [Rhizoctonia solani AG-1 IB]
MMSSCAVFTLHAGNVDLFELGSLGMRARGVGRRLRARALSTRDRWTRAPSTAISILIRQYQPAWVVYAM